MAYPVRLLVETDFLGDVEGFVIYRIVVRRRQQGLASCALGRRSVSAILLLTRGAGIAGVRGNGRLLAAVGSQPGGGLSVGLILAILLGHGYPRNFVF